MVHLDTTSGQSGSVAWASRLVGRAEGAGGSASVGVAPQAVEAESTWALQVPSGAEGELEGPGA